MAGSSSSGHCHAWCTRGRGGSGSGSGSGCEGLPKPAEPDLHSPGHAASGLPPLLVQVGTADLLLSDSERLATAAAEAGVDVILEIGEGLPHVYQILLGTPEAAEATQQIGTFLRARVRSPDSP